MSSFDKDQLWRHYIDKDYPRALALGSDHLKQVHAHDALFVCALSLIKLGHERIGTDWGIGALAIIEPNADRYADLARTLLDCKNYRNAAMFIDTALKSFPDNATLNYLQAVTLSYCGHYDAALVALDHTLELE